MVGGSDWEVCTVGKGSSDWRLVGSVEGSAPGICAPGVVVCDVD